MSEHSSTIRTVAAEASERNLSDIEAATDDALSQLRSLPWFEAYVDTLVRDAIRREVCEARHRMSTAIKRSAGQYGGPPKVNVGQSNIVKAVATACLFNMPFDGRTLGELKGEELPELAEKERNYSRGYANRASLLERLSSIVPPKKMVQRAVKEETVRDMWDDITGKHESAEVFAEAGT